MQWYSNSKDAIIMPKAFAPRGLRDTKLGVLIFVGRVYDWMRTVVGDVVMEANSGVFGALKFFVTKDGLAVFHAYFGAPATVGLAEVLIAAGVERLMMLGQAGAIKPGISCGELLVPTFAVREEGTSYHYLPPDVAAKPCRSLCRKIESLLDSKGLPYKQGGVWTTDAPFRETRDKVMKYSSLGVLAVEMECSALFTVAQYRHAKAAAVLVITDLLHEKIWTPAFNDQKVINKEKDIAEILAKSWFNLIA